MPSVNAFVVTPVAAHSLTLRPLVVPDTSKIDIVVNTGEDEAYLSIDGQVGMPMNDGDRVACRKSEQKVKLLRIKETFFDVLRAKLKWAAYLVGSGTSSGGPSAFPLCSSIGMRQRFIVPSRSLPK